MGSTQLTGSQILDNVYVIPETGKIFWLNDKKRVKANQEAGVIKRGSLADGGGYRVIEIDGVKCRAHHLVWVWCKGRWPSGELDHENGHRDDNRIDNLREATVPQNRTNKTIQSNNKCGYKWVSYHPQSRKWRAEIRKDGRRIFDFLHADPSVAYDAACAAAQEIHGAFFNPGR